MPEKKKLMCIVAYFALGRHDPDKSDRETTRDFNTAADYFIAAEPGQPGGSHWPPGGGPAPLNNFDGGQGPGNSWY